MIQLENLADCCGCCACASACPQAAITMKEDAMGFLYPVTDALKCTDCGICDSICSFRLPQGGTSPRAEAIRFPEFLGRSQSGGLSYALMQKAVRNGYVVYGAAMDDMVVRHRRVENEAGLEAFRLSKYVQSNLAGIPAMVRGDLAAGRKVLFTGTPCQCAGIVSTARGFRKNLLVADIICHGVPGPALWKDYVASRRRMGKGDLLDAKFRDPAYGWHEAFESFTFDTGKVKCDDYSFLYYSCLMMRPSCHRCPFTSLVRPSDITMGDCWGVEEVLPGFADDDRGCSLMLLNTEAGEEFTREFLSPCERKELPLDKVMQLNLHSPSVAHKRAAAFRKTYIRKGFDTALKHFGRGAFVHRWDRFISKHFSGK